MRWRIIDLVKMLWDDFAVSVSRTTLSRELRALGHPIPATSATTGSTNGKRMMRHHLITITALATFCAMSTAAVLASDKPSTWSRHENSEDAAMISEVVNQFRLGIIAKDGKALSKLLLNSRIVFNQIDDQAAIDKGRAFDVHYDGLGAPGFSAFSRYLANEKARVEERFNNISVTQDGPLALVTFDYQFLADGKVENRGVEHWMLRKIDGKWKIFSVVWTAT
jgi:hypothetical protein